MKCTACGREIEDNQKFCKYCGASVKQIQVSTENTDQTMRCKGCGAALKPGIVFCTQCGAKVSAMGSVPVAKENDKTKGSAAGKIIIAVITVIALALVVFIGYYFADQYGVFEQDRKKVETDLENAQSKKSVDEETKTTESMPDEEIVSEELSVAEDVDEETKTTESIPDEEVVQEELPVAKGVDVIDVEDIVSRIRDQYNKIVNGMSSDSYDIITVDEGITAYSEQNQIKAIVVKKDYGGSDYARYFYFDNGKLFFAYYEGSDSHRLYFNENQLIRWRYCPDAADSSNATNYDMETTTSYLQWEQRVKDDAFYLENKWKDAFSTGNNVTQIDNANIRDIDATSYLDESKYNIVHLPERAIDGDLETGWAEGVSGQGIGESITIYFDGMYLVSGVEIYAGYQKNEDLYYKNSRPKEIYVEFSDGSGESHILKDMNDVQNMKFANPVITDSITLRIDSVYSGDKYEDTVITEISPY